MVQRIFPQRFGSGLARMAANTSLQCDVSAFGGAAPELGR